jgi:allantoinase
VRVVRSDRVVVGGEERPASITIDHGKIVEISSPGPADLDFGDLVIMPGLVDSHVHVNDPGRADWEGFATATRAAAAGGTTTIVDMPLNSVPPTVTVAALHEKQAAADGKLTVDTAFWGGLIPGGEADLAPLAQEGVCGFKSFLVDSGVPEFPPIGADELASALPVIADLGLPSLIHAEDPMGLGDLDGDPRVYDAYVASRPPAAEASAIALLASLTRESRASVHVLHISSAEAVAVLDPAITGMSGETCPHYLTFCAEEIGDGATVFKCAPPIRSATHREALWEALRDGRLAMVVSDHSPAPNEVKDLEGGDFGRAWGGIGSLQLRLPATWTGAAARGAGLIDMAVWLAEAPAKLAGIDDRKGSIAVGRDADFVVWDPDGSIEVRGDRLEHRHPITPYQGMSLRGQVRATILRGEIVYDGDTIVGGRGRMLRRR